MKTIYSEAKQQLSNCMLSNKACSNVNENEIENLNETKISSDIITDKNFTYETDCTIGGDGDDETLTSPSSGSYGHAGGGDDDADGGGGGNHYRCNFSNHSHFMRTTGDTTTSTYDTLQRPFKYDKLRGKWSSSADFYFACTSHAFGTAIFSEVPVYALLFSGVYFIPAYLISIILYAIPIFAIQTFLGQFSSSGTISALRVAPIFKGLGYSILLLNLTSLAYYAIIAAVPLIYAANSLHTVIPWMSCDNAWNTANCSTHENYDDEDEYLYQHATVEFFRYIIRTAHDSSTDFSLSWPILCGAVGVWLLTLAMLLKKISFIGKFLRCCCIFMISCFIAVIAHLVIHEKMTWSQFSNFFEPTLGSSSSAILGGMRSAIFMATWVLGPGYGSVLTLASFNNFRRNSEKLSYWATGTHVAFAFCAMICGRIALDHFEDHVGMFHFHVEEEHFMQFLYLCFAYLFGSMTSLPNLWSFLFFGMLFVAELSAVIIQMLTVLTALFDEFENLRAKKTHVTVGLALTMMVASIYFCTKQGFEHLHMLPTVAYLTYVIISMILLLMVVWIYGRERFQCDLQFMLGKTISNFKIFLLRFITPAFLVISILQIVFFLERDVPPALLLQCVIFIIVPVYMVYKLCCTSGCWRSRVNQCLAPHDWHPVDSDNWHFYEELMGTSEMLVISDSEQFAVP